MICQFPQHLVVFANILEDVELSRGLFAESDNKLLIDAMIDGIFIPSLLKFELIAKDEKYHSGYRPLFSGIEIDKSSFSNSEWGNFVEGMSGIASQAIKYGDQEKVFIGEAIFGSVANEMLTDMFEDIKAVIKKYSEKSRTRSSRVFLSIAGKEF